MTDFEKWWEKYGPVSFPYYDDVKLIASSAWEGRKRLDAKICRDFVRADSDYVTVSTANGCADEILKIQ